MKGPPSLPVVFSIVTFAVAATGATPKNFLASPSASSRGGSPSAHRYRIAEMIRRDPFEGAPLPGSPSPEPEQLPDAVLLDDESEPAAAPTPGETTLLKATIVGHFPVAYVAEGHSMHVVTVGGLVGARRVIEIDATGVVLDDGSRLDLSNDNAVPTPLPLQNRWRRVERRPAAAVASEPAPTPTALATMSITPGPLPTIKSGAYPVGAPPSSDPAAPTAFPYPFPYAPK